MKRVCHGSTGVLVAMAVAVFTACEGAKSPVSPEPANAAVGGTAATGTVTSNAGDDANRASFPVGSQLARVRQATLKYHDVAVAIEDGYELDPLCVESPAGGMGVHAVNLELMRIPGVVAEQPEVLLYEPKPGGKYQLVGVEYLEFVMLQPTGGGDPMPWFGPTQWSPAEYAVVNQHPSLFGKTFDGPMQGHGPGMPWHWDFHVWIWNANPSGTFAQFNPNVSCSSFVPPPPQ